MKIEVSIIVPVHNVEQYLPTCIESIINQSFHDIEIIFVDDGSNDRSVAIIEEYQQKDDRIKLIKQQNMYAGVARNNGMTIASGKYIMFLDSDDFFELNMVEETYNYAEKNSAEIVLFGYWEFDDQTHINREHPFAKLPKSIFSWKDVDSIYTTCSATPWDKLFLRSFITDNNLSFQNIRKSNDTYFTNMAMSLSTRMLYVKKRYVHYRVNNLASLQGNCDKDRESGISCQKAIKAALKSKDIFCDKLKESFYKRTCDVLSYYGRNIGSKDNYEKYFEALKKYLIPELFENSSDFSECNFLCDVYESCDFDDFLVRRLREVEKELKLKNDYVSKNTIDYKLGRLLLSVPRKVKRIIER